MQTPTTVVRHFPRAMTSKGAAALTALTEDGAGKTFAFMSLNANGKLDA
ncbi:hypothetical protein V5R04_03700 [Jonesiaceae bacterium BS-20]|uniref:Uncharacterized protein n=1 Tax=Jonesiaceae bacterium BS-20 TaxID=3120821 RepID=A0AAU7DX98_9MICO